MLVGRAEHAAQHIAWIQEGSRQAGGGPYHRFVTATLYRDAALADGRGPRLRLGVSILVIDGRIEWIRPTEDEPALDGSTDVVDATGCTIVPGLVDAHSHITGPGGAHWIARFADPPGRLVAVAEANGRLASSAGVRWLRDVGSPVGVDPVDGRRRAVALGVRDRWRDQPRHALRACRGDLGDASRYPAGGRNGRGRERR